MFFFKLIQQLITKKNNGICRNLKTNITYFFINKKNIIFFIV